MTRAWLVVVTGACALAALTTESIAQVPVPTNERALVAEAPIVAGNLAAAKQKALIEAWRRAVERCFVRALGSLGIPGPLAPPLSELGAKWMQNPRQIVRGYRVVSQGEYAGNYRVEIEVDLDEATVRREIAKLAASAPGVSSGAGGKGGATAVGATVLPVTPVGVILFSRGTPPPIDAEAIKAFGAALGSVGIRTETKVASEQTERTLAPSDGIGAAVRITATTQEEGPVRGTAMRSVRCRMTVHVVGDGSNEKSDESVPMDRGFAGDDAGARKACFENLSRRLADRMAPGLAASIAFAAERRALVLILDLPESGTLGVVQRALRRMAAVSSSEVRRVAAARVELRVATRMDGKAMATALTTELGSVATVEVTDAGPRRLEIRVRRDSIPPGSVPHPALPAAIPAPTGTP